MERRKARQPRRLHGRACRVGLREERLVDVVHRREIVHVREEDRGPDHVAVGETAGFEQRADVLEHPARLRADVAVELANLEKIRGDKMVALGAASLEEIEKNPALLALARARGKTVFGDNCAPCHGSGGAGATACTRDLLRSTITAYFTALAAHSAATLPLATHGAFTS